jgi:hypothetical protein
VSWTTAITLTNKRPEDVLCTIPKGLVFENKTIGTTVQNVAASREYKLIIPAGSTMRVTIDVYCINRPFSPPSGQSGRITIFKIDRPFADQDELWAIMEQGV